MRYRETSDRSPRLLSVQRIRPPACTRGPGSIRGPACIITCQVCVILFKRSSTFMFTGYQYFVLMENHRSLIQICITPSRESTPGFILSASPVTSRLTSSFTCQLISIIITTFIIHHSFTLSLQAQNLPFQHRFSLLRFLFPTGLPS